MRYTEEQKNRFELLMNSYRDIDINGNQEQVVECLREVQEIFGCIPGEAQLIIAKVLPVQEVIIRTLIKRYPSLTEEAYDHEIVICRGRACNCKGSAELFDEIEHLLGITDGQVTADGKFKLRGVNCMHSCRTAPNIKVNRDSYGKVTKEQIQEILNKYL